MSSNSEQRSNCRGPQSDAALSRGEGGYPRSSAVVEATLREFPEFRIVAKHGRWHQALIHQLLRVATLGRQCHYMTRYHTVMGYTLFVPESWRELDDMERAILLRHERIHLRQRRRYGLIPFAALYLLPLLPIGLAYGRARLEWEAYAETLRATAELKGLEAARSPALHAQIVERFVGPDYLWMWPFPKAVQSWIDQLMSTLRSEGAEMGKGRPR